MSFINQLFTKFKNLYIDLFCSPIVVNACLFYSWGKIVHRNWGDDINYFLLKALTRKHISYLYTSSLSMRKKKDNYLVIGSTITLLTTPQTIIWGAGVIDPNNELPSLPKKILAVRGPLTRQYFLNRGVDCPEIYGDPAMLIKYLISPSISKPVKQDLKKYKLGIVPHYKDFSHPSIQKIQKDKDVIVIKMEGYKNWIEVVNQICSCEYIASSSLHGLIIAETYNIPNLWIELYGKLLGGYFKFHDFFLAMGYDREKPFIVNTHTSIDDILATKSKYIKGNIDLKPLIECAPFKLHINYTINNDKNN